MLPRPYTRLLLSCALADLAFNAPVTLVPLWLIARHEDSGHIALAMFLPLLVNLAFTLPSGWISDRINSARALHIGILGSLLLTAAMAAASGWEAFAALMSVRACFISLFATASFSMAIQVSRPERSMYAVTWLAMAITASYAVGPAAVTFAWKHGFEHVQFAWCAAAAVASAFIAFTLRRASSEGAVRPAERNPRRAHVTEWLAPLFFAMSVSTVAGVNNTLAVVALHQRGLDGGLLFSGAAAGMLAARIPAAAAVNRYGTTAPSVALALLMAGGTVCVAAAATNAWVVGGGFLIGVAWSAMLPACTQALIALAGPQARGRAMAAYGFALSLGGVAGSAAATHFADAAGGYATTLIGAGLLPVLGVCGLLFVARRQPVHQPAI